MSTKNNALLLAVYAAIGVAAPSVAAVPVLETLLNDYTVTAVHAVQVNDNGGVIVMADVSVGGAPSVLRPVCNSLGDIRTFADMGMVYPLLKKAKLQAGAEIQFYRKEKMIVLGDPLASLKTLFKAFKAEKLAVDKAKMVIDAKIVAATGLGWNTAMGTPERAEYDDYIQRRASTDEAIAFCAARITALAASLVAAGVDPLTVV